MTFKSSAKSHDHNSVDSNLTSNTTGLFSSINASKDSSSVGKSMSTHISDSKAKELGYVSFALVYFFGFLNITVCVLQYVKELMIL